MSNGIPMIGKPSPEEIFARGTIIVICKMDGMHFAWFVNDELAAKITQADADILVNQFKESLRLTAAKKGNILR